MLENRVYLLRHGETEWSRDGRHTSRTDIALTAGGERAARRAGETLAELRTTSDPLVLVSPRQRARRTAGLAGLRETRVEPLLVEWDYGEYEGLSTPHIRAARDQEWTLWTHGAPGGESAPDIEDRADRLLETVRAATSDVILVGHGHFSRCLIARWLDGPATSGAHYALDAASIAVLGYERDVPQLVRGNVPPRPEAA